MKTSIPIHVDEMGADWITWVDEAKIQLTGRDGEDWIALEDCPSDILAAIVSVQARKLRLLTECVSSDTL